MADEIFGGGIERPLAPVAARRGTVRRMLHWLRCRRDTADLAEVDDWVLRDLGLTRGDLARGLRKPPLPDDEATELADPHRRVE